MAAVKPGDLAGSEVWSRISSEDEDVVMPPPESNRKLTAQEKAKIKAWIQQGARYAGHWSFISPRKAPLPNVREGVRTRNEIDRFAFERLAGEGLSPSPEADRHTLIRRLSFDLTGLPPSAEDVAVFASNNNPNAYEALVDRLLKSPHYGERMAPDWRSGQTHDVF